MHRSLSVVLSLKVGLVFVVTFLCASLLTSSAQSQDVTPPVLTGVSFTPAVVDVTTDPAILTIQLSATDDLSGVGNIEITFVGSVTGTRNFVTHCGSLPSTIATCTGSTAIPVGSPSETWTVLEIRPRDALDNESTYTTMDLIQIGFPTEVVVVGLGEDVTPPVITISAHPGTLWPPNGQLVPITVSGTITDEPEGSVVSNATYQVMDEYGQIQPSGTFAPGADGEYSFTVELQASRRDNDRDGRRYTIVVSATDDAGNLGSASTIVTVPHNQGR